MKHYRTFVFILLSDDWDASNVGREEVSRNEHRISLDFDREVQMIRKAQDVKVRGHTTLFGAAEVTILLSKNKFEIEAKSEILNCYNVIVSNRN